MDDSLKISHQTQGTMKFKKESLYYICNSNTSNILIVVCSYIIAYRKQTKSGIILYLQNQAVV